jgi:hypothetical protein
MTYDDAVRRLQNHANWPRCEGPEDKSLLTLTYRFVEGAADSDALQIAYDDAVECLEVANLHLNGSTPSEAVRDSKADLLDRELCLILGVLVHALLSAGRATHDDDVSKILLVYAWRISNAWLAVLFGDIDDLRRHIALEEQVKFST